MRSRPFPIPRNLLAIIFLASLATAASAQSAEQTFRDTVLHKQRFLRDFHAESTIDAEWDQGTVKVQPATYRTFAVLVADAIKIKADRIEISGIRYTADYKAGSNVWLQSARTDTTIRVKTHGAPPSDVFAQLDAALFFPSADAAMAALPEEYRHEREGKPRATQKPKVCDCSDHQTEGCAEKQMHVSMAGMKPPTLLRQADFELTEEAKRAKSNGMVGIHLKVDILGRTSAWWIDKSGGMGEDFEAVKAASAYQFAPATCHNMPVPITLFIDMNFQFQ